ncbi:MAG: hypothetical protein KME11_03670 [Timaviella obliquedivisa GSE-PSE-MK23-08B]|jgi:hypothetical protein|nr:hypothetical protein [Timaviella obliquedivisa GSE-PSE-MK23-08B]
MKLENLLPSIRATSTEHSTPTLRPWKGFGLGEMAQKLVSLLSGDREPKVYHRRDRQGYSYLEVYDPASRKTHTFKTTHEARVWLERRYYS